MTKLQERVIELVTIRQGMKGVDLAAILATEFIGEGSEVILDQIDDLVNEGWLVEIEYILPLTEYRIKSFFLPKNTSINITSL
jgi:hypothetical protein